ncbi:putative multidrug resistance protein MdtD [Streptomyces sp. RB5]|uniref:Putative multidrug resistance protein MdtD n=1 Tax=Streptomyces smaragdinus TaxID=2585196 RepID=A0A7K0CES6_9ACTN|nr:DHA2 family efflux MFS transporter permease subunit [Streptomyces smaragdinus]MQY11971.1 putative multidrug resistance protein MdtD [Streptomyces smaragdinus]
MSTTATDTGNAAGPPGEDDDKITPDILKVAGAVVLGMIMAILDTTVVNVALPTFLTEFEVDAYSTVAWSITGYTLALAAVIPVTGWAADRFGTKRLYVAALALFTLGSILCAFAWSIEALIAFRVLQGLGGGMLAPLGMTIMTKAAGPHRMGRLMAVLGIPMLLGPIGGPILGGWLIDAVSWHWIFLINLPLGIVAIIYAIVVLPKDAPEPSETFDVVGMLLMSPGLALFLYGVSSIPGEGTVTAAKVLIPGLIGLALIVSFVFWAFRPQHPLLDLRLFQDRNLTVSTLVMFLFAGSFFGAMLLVPTYFQQVRGEDVLTAGLLVAPQGIGAMVTMPIAGILADKWPVGRIVPLGMVLIIAGITGMALNSGVDTPYWRLILCLFVMGLGMGFAMMPTFTAALKTLKAHQVARGSTLINVIQQVAASVGVAVMSVVLTNQQNASEAFKAASALANAEATKVAPPAWATETAKKLGEAFQPTALSDLADAFVTTYWVAAAALVITLIATAFMPRKLEKTDPLSKTTAPPVMH